MTKGRIAAAEVRSRILTGNGLRKMATRVEGDAVHAVVDVERIKGGEEVVQEMVACALRSKLQGGHFFVEMRTSGRLGDRSGQPVRPLSHFPLRWPWL